MTADNHVVQSERPFVTIEELHSLYFNCSAAVGAHEMRDSQNQAGACDTLPGFS